jgi:L-fucose isomerase-like protein
VRLVVIPFGYPDYPRQVVESQVERANRLLAGLEALFLDTVYTRDDSLQVRRRLRELDPALVVAMLVSWLEAPNLMDALGDWFGRPLVLWSHTTILLDGRKQTLGAFVGAGVVKQSLEDFGVPFEFLYGRPDDAGLVEQIGQALQAASAARRLRTARIGLFGYPALGMYTATVDHVQLRRQLGPEIVHFDQYQLVAGLESVAEEEARGVLRRLPAGELPEEQLLPAARMYAVLRNLARQHSLDALTVKCQYELSQLYKYTPCVALSLLADELPASCEGDLLTLVSQLALHLLSGAVAGYADVHEVLEDRVLLAACGFAPFSLARTACLGRWAWEAFSGPLNCSPYRSGELTLARLARDGERFKLHCAFGFAEPKSEWNEVGCPPFPGLDLRIQGGGAQFARQLVSNHYAFAYGDHRAGLERLCRHLGVRYCG